MSDDYYALLGIEPDADSEAVRAAFEAKLGDATASDGEASLRRAFAVLGNASRRAVYDELRRRDQQPPTTTPEPEPVEVAVPTPAPPQSALPPPPPQLAATPRKQGPPAFVIVVALVALIGIGVSLSVIWQSLFGPPHRPPAVQTDRSGD